MTGSVTAGGGADVLRGTLRGDQLTVVSTAQHDPQDDCDLHPVTLVFTASGDTLTLTSATGEDSEGDGAGGHSSLTPITGGTGTLTRQ